MSSQAKLSDLDLNPLSPRACGRERVRVRGAVQYERKAGFEHFLRHPLTLALSLHSLRERGRGDKSARGGC